MKKKILFVFSLYVGGAVYATEWNYGENLLVEPPRKEKYDMYVKSQEGWDSTLWQSKISGAADTFTVNVFRGMEMKPREYREIQDKPGREACQEFETTVTDDSIANGYSSLFWQTACEIDGVEINILQRAIAGKDSFYHVRKSWKSPVSEQDMEYWKGHIGSVTVCDTRGENSPCPSGYTKVEGESPNQ